MIVCEDDNKAQHRRDQEAYQSWVKEDCCVCFTMLSNMHNDLIGKFEVHATTHAMWNALKLKFGGTFVTILRGLNIKLYSYKMCPNHTMKQHLRTMSTMIRKLKAAGNTLTEEQKIQARLCSLPDSWETMLISLTQSDNIKTFYDVSRHLDLEVERLEASKTTKAAKYGSTYMANNDSRAPRGPKCKNYARRQDSGNGIVPKKEKNTKHKRNKRNGKGKNGKSSTVIKRDTLLVIALSQERYSLTSILAKVLFPLMLWLFTHIHIGLLIQERSNMLQETKSSLQSIVEFQRGVEDSTQGMELACKCRAFTPTSWNCAEDVLYCCMMFSCSGSSAKLVIIC